MHHLRPWLKSGIPEIQVWWEIKFSIKIQFSTLLLYRYWLSMHPSIKTCSPKVYKKFRSLSLVNDFNFLNIHIPKILFSWTFFISRDFIICSFGRHIEANERMFRVIQSLLIFFIIGIYILRSRRFLVWRFMWYIRIIEMILITNLLFVV